MNRVKKHRIKEEKATTSSANKRAPEEQDLAYFIHDRVELMHQVFSVLKSKELKSLAPECVRRLSTDDLQELCLEELLGISSKRLCAILDGAEPPSDTDSSSQSAEQLETISLDSISSDDEILSQGSGKKKKHKHRHSKKKRRKKSKGSGDEGENRASRAGLTVLELLELQARARAIRAQLHQEPARVQETAAERASSDNDEVLIKEEPAEVVEISSEDEKPDLASLHKQIGASTSQSNETETNNRKDDSHTVTKRINDLIITVPQSKPTRKIKLKRQKPPETVTRQETTNKVTEHAVEVRNTVNTITSNTSKTVDKEPVKISNVEAKNKSKKSKKKKKKVKEKTGSDEDEITIQLSDTEKMDLLEDLDAKNLDTVSSSDDSSDDDQQNDGKEKGKVNDENREDISKDTSHDLNPGIINETNEPETVIAIELEGKEEVKKDDEIRGYISNDNADTVEINDLPVVVDEVAVLENNKDNSSDLKIDDKEIDATANVSNTVEDLSKKVTGECVSNENANGGKAESSCQETKSDGELSDRESSEIEASDVQSEVVCISDDEGKKKKKKKKEKKSKKEKKKSGFREELDENFYKEKVEGSSTIVVESVEDDDDVYEYLEISDDSSCYEVEGVSVLSKEPTAEEIEAFSARMDEIEIESQDKVIPSADPRTDLNETSNIENVSWKDRYLGSKKVKRVLTTSNILNAIRKKNIELKKKLEDAKKAEKAKIKTDIEKDGSASTVEEGTIEHYETLEGSTKYVDPVKEIEPAEENKDDKETKEDQSENVTREMKKDAKMLLKMYKRLLKYNDINKQKDPNKKKKKKQKKSKDKEKEKLAVG